MYNIEIIATGSGKFIVIKYEIKLKNDLDTNYLILIICKTLIVFLEINYSWKQKVI